MNQKLTWRINVLLGVDFVVKSVKYLAIGLLCGLVATEYPSWGGATLTLWVVALGSSVGAVGAFVFGIIDIVSGLMLRADYKQYLWHPATMKLAPLSAAQWRMGDKGFWPNYVLDVLGIK